MHEKRAVVADWYLQHAARVVKPGSSFLRRMTDLAQVAKDITPPHSPECKLLLRPGMVGPVLVGLERDE